MQRKQARCSLYVPKFLDKLFTKKMTHISNSEYQGLTTTKTLHRLSFYTLDTDVKEREADATPSLQETKKVELKIPEDKPEVPKVTIDELTLSKEAGTVEAVSSILEKYGVCVVKNLFNKEQVSRINSDLNPEFEARKNDPRLFPKETIRVTASVARSPAVVREVLNNPLHVAISEKFLAKKNAFWIGENINIGYSPSIVSSSIGFRVGPGSQLQALHRDDHSEHNVNVETEEYIYGRETQVGISVALSNVTKENGGTRFIPGSHLWDHLRQPHEEDCIQVEGLEEGDAFFMLGSVFHGASRNLTKDEFRTLLILFMCSSTSRQKENIYLETPIEYWRQFTPQEMRLLGLSMSEPFSNMLELQDPLIKIKPGYVRRSNYSDVCKVVRI